MLSRWEKQANKTDSKADRQLINVYREKDMRNRGTAFLKVTNLNT